MVLWGSLVNAIAIILGTTLGLIISLKENLKTTVMHALSLTVIVIGLKMGFLSENILIPIASLVLGSIVGEKLKVEDRIVSVGRIFEKHFKSQKGGITEGFLTATLVYCVGAMAVVGALDSGLMHNHDVLYAKSMLDGISAIFFASSFGIGVAFSAIPVFLYQGGIALLATTLAPILNDAVVGEMTATGGILIFGIGINMLGLTKISIGNMLPSLVFAVVLSSIFL